MRRSLTLTIFCLAGTAAASAQSPVVGVGTFIHVVANLDKTMRFYGDRLGLELNGAPGPRDFSANAVVENLYDAKGSQSRVAVFKIPGSPLGLEFVEFKGVVQQPFRPRVQDPGASLLIVPVRDVDSAMAKLREDTTPVLDNSILKDPDGFYVRLVGSGSRGGLSLTVDGTDRSLHLFHDQLGFQFEGNSAKVPGTGFEVELAKIRGGDRQTAAESIHDPGAGVLRLFVRDAASLLRTLKAAGVPVVSAGGEPVSIGARKAVILRTPDNFFIQIFDQPNPAQQ